VLNREKEKEKEEEKEEIEETIEIAETIEIENLNKNDILYLVNIINLDYKLHSEPSL